MEPFVKVFFSIDKQQNEEISMEELRDFVKENKLDEDMITRWKSLFDPEGTNRITLSKFCDVLGLKAEEVRRMRTAEQAQAPRLHPDIIVLTANMLPELQIAISEEVRLKARPLETFDADKISKYLKQWLDKNYDPAWHVVVVKGSHWITYSYSPNNSFQFRLYDYTYLIWRTPNLELIP